MNKLKPAIQQWKDRGVCPRCINQLLICYEGLEFYCPTQGQWKIHTKAVRRDRYYRRQGSTYGSCLWQDSIDLLLNKYQVHSECFNIMIEVSGGVKYYVSTRLTKQETGEWEEIYNRKFNEGLTYRALAREYRYTAAWVHIKLKRMREKKLLAIK